jgi:hypothetical protein
MIQEDGLSVIHCGENTVTLKEETDGTVGSVLGCAG